jgi:urease accessory protein
VTWRAARGGTVLADLRQEGCLKLRFPRGARAEATLLNSSGGVAAGDRLTITAMLGAGAEAAISTQSAERIYRALPDDGAARIDARLTLEPGAALDWLPQETILFDGCALDRQLDVALHHSARFLGIESLVFGRAAMGETVREGALHDRIRIRRDGALIWHDAIRLHGPIAAILQRPAVAAGRHAVATLVHVAPEAEALCEALRAALETAPGEAGVSAWNGMLVARLLADSSLLLRRTVLACLAALGRAPPRVWNC